ncbi:Uncharacterised protein [Streptococcus pneumoniae]|nr:Uncharacterised protein [Streptococcus pneumoniae]
MKAIKNGVFEADVTTNTDKMNRFGFIYRVQNSSTYTYVGTGDTNDQYFGETFGPINNWTSMTSNVPLKAKQTYHLRLVFMDDVATSGCAID